MPNLSVAFVGLATLAPIFVTKRRLRLRSTPVAAAIIPFPEGGVVSPRLGRPRRAALAILALLTACASPPPTPGAVSTPSATSVAVTALPATAAAPASTSSPSGGVATSGGVPSAATPAAVDTLSPDQRSALADARLLLVEGDFP